MQRYLEGRRQLKIEAFSWHLPEGTEENDEKSQSE
jgi:hypothetical protein